MARLAISSSPEDLLFDTSLTALLTSWSVSALKSTSSEYLYPSISVRPASGGFGKNFAASRLAFPTLSVTSLLLTSISVLVYGFYGSPRFLVHLASFQTLFMLPCVSSTLFLCVQVRGPAMILFFRRPTCSRLVLAAFTRCSGAARACWNSLRRFWVSAHGSLHSFANSGFTFWVMSALSTPQQWLDRWPELA